MKTWDDIEALMAAAPAITGTQAAASDQTAEEVLLAHLGIKVLGEKKNGTIVCFDSERCKRFEIRQISRYTFEELLQNIGPVAKEYVWGHKGEKPDTILYTMAQAREAIATVGGETTLGDYEILGGGVWEVDDKLIVVGRRELAILNGSGQLEPSRFPRTGNRLIDFDSCDTWCDFSELNKHLKSAQSLKWRQAGLSELISLFGRWDNWKHKYDPELVAALVIATWLQTVWEWRPIVTVIGPRNSGKTFLLQRCLAGSAEGGIFRGMSVCCQDASRAGIAQELGTTAMALFLDEFEASQHRKEVQAYLRTTGRGGRILRGTAGQDGTSYQLHVIPWTGAIEHGRQNAADASRGIVLELTKVRQVPGKKLLQLPTKVQLSDLGLRCLAIGMTIWKDVKSRADYVHSVGIPGVDSRIVESYSLPCAILGVILSVDEAGTTSLLEEVLAERDLCEQQADDDDLLLDAIWDSIVRCNHGQTATVGELVTITSIPNPYDELRKIGIYMLDASQQILFASGPLATHMGHHEEWRGKNLGLILARIDGARKVRQRMPPAGRAVRGVLVPRVEVNKLLGSGSVAATEEDNTGAF